MERFGIAVVEIIRKLRLWPVSQNELTSRLSRQPRTNNILRANLQSLKNCYSITTVREAAEKVFG